MPTIMKEQMEASIRVTPQQAFHQAAGRHQ